ncbi:unnamed protein product, partial [Meganyctiphanes norvegica]
QVFHVCEPANVQHDFLCPKGTIFNQKYIVCDWWYNVDCPKSAEFFELNLDFFKEGEVTISPHDVVSAITSGAIQQQRSQRQRKRKRKRPKSQKQVSQNPLLSPQPAVYIPPVLPQSAKQVAPAVPGSVYIPPMPPKTGALQTPASQGFKNVAGLQYSIPSRQSATQVEKKSKQRRKNRKRPSEPMDHYSDEYYEYDDEYYYDDDEYYYDDPATNQNYQKQVQHQGLKTQVTPTPHTNPAVGIHDLRTHGDNIHNNLPKRSPNPGVFFNPQPLNSRPHTPEHHISQASSGAKVNSFSGATSFNSFNPALVPNLASIPVHPSAYEPALPKHLHHDSSHKNPPRSFINFNLYNASPKPVHLGKSPLSPTVISFTTKSPHNHIFEGNIPHHNADHHIQQRPRKPKRRRRPKIVDHQPAIHGNNHFPTAGPNLVGNIDNPFVHIQEFHSHKPTQKNFQKEIRYSNHVTSLPKNIYVTPKAVTPVPHIDHHHSTTPAPHHIPITPSSFQHVTPYYDSELYIPASDPSYIGNDDNPFIKFQKFHQNKAAFEANIAYLYQQFALQNSDVLHESKGFGPHPPEHHSLELPPSYTTLAPPPSYTISTPVGHNDHIYKTSPKPVTTHYTSPTKAPFAHYSPTPKRPVIQYSPPPKPPINNYSPSHQTIHSSPKPKSYIDHYTQTKLPAPQYHPTPSPADGHFTPFGKVKVMQYHPTPRPKYHTSPAPSHYHTTPIAKVTVQQYHPTPRPKYHTSPAPSHHHTTPHAKVTSEQYHPTPQPKYHTPTAPSLLHHTTPQPIHYSSTFEYTPTPKPPVIHHHPTPQKYLTPQNKVVTHHYTTKQPVDHSHWHTTEQPHITAKRPMSRHWVHFSTPGPAIHKQTSIEHPPNSYDAPSDPHNTYKAPVELDHAYEAPHITKESYGLPKSEIERLFNPHGKKKLHHQSNIYRSSKIEHEIDPIHHHKYTTPKASSPSYLGNNDYTVTPPAVTTSYTYTPPPTHDPYKTVANVHSFSPTHSPDIKYLLPSHDLHNSYTPSPIHSTTINTPHASYKAPRKPVSSHSPAVTYSPSPKTAHAIASHSPKSINFPHVNYGVPEEEIHISQDHPSFPHHIPQNFYQNDKFSAQLYDFIRNPFKPKPSITFVDEHPLKSYTRVKKSQSSGEISANAAAPKNYITTSNQKVPPSIPAVTKSPPTETRIENPVPDLSSDPNSPKALNNFLGGKLVYDAVFTEQTHPEIFDSELENISKLAQGEKSTGKRLIGIRRRVIKKKKSSKANSPSERTVSTTSLPVIHAVNTSNTPPLRQKTAVSVERNRSVNRPGRRNRKPGKIPHRRSHTTSRPHQNLDVKGRDVTPQTRKRGQPLRSKLLNKFPYRKPKTRLFVSSTTSSSKENDPKTIEDLSDSQLQSIVDSAFGQKIER